MGDKADEGVKAMQAESAEAVEEQKGHGIELVGEKKESPMSWINGDTDKQYFLACGVTRDGFDRVCADVKRKGFEEHKGPARMRGISPDADLHQVFEIGRSTADKHNESRHQADLRRMEKASLSQAARRRPGNQEVIRLSDGSAVAIRPRVTTKTTGGKPKRARKRKSISTPGSVIKK